MRRMIGGPHGNSGATLRRVPDHAFAELSCSMLSSFSLSTSRSATSARTERARAQREYISRRETTFSITYLVLVSTLPGNSFEMFGCGRRSVLR